MKSIQVLLVTFLVVFGPLASARSQVDDSTGQLVTEDQVKPAQTSPAEEPRPQQIGPSAAEKYFRKSKPARSPAAASQGEPIGAEDHYLALGIGGFLNGDSYSWGATPHNSGAGRLVAELTYRIAPVSSLADWALRADYMGFGLPEGSASELAVSPVLMFPDSGSKFPLYFGIGAGPGIFISQISQTSVIAINYQVFAGVRFFNIIDNTGFFLETGLKNLFLLTSQGQFNGAFLTAGAVFTF